jgi:hypothetical protein
MLDFDKTVISQYSSSPVLCSLLDLYNDAVDPVEDFQQFYDKIWNIDTAVGYGLDVWGRIVGIGRVLTLASGQFLGFSGPAGASGDSFNAGIWYSGQPATSNFALTDQAYRQLIFAKAAANLTDDSIPSINLILREFLFPNRGVCYVQDNLNMSLTYVFQFALTPPEISIVTSSGVLPTPAGVLPLIVHP